MINRLLDTPPNHPIHQAHTLSMVFDGWRRILKKTHSKTTFMTGLHHTFFNNPTNHPTNLSHQGIL